MDKNSNISDIIKNILKYLQYELDMYKNPGSYQDEEYYIKCDTKVDAYEDAINIVKNIYLNNILIINNKK
jgi:SepF-like predicted cell division protein (DUF552 family)